MTLTCIHCGSAELARNGFTQNGKQRYLCSDCGRRSRENPQPNGYTLQAREQILRAYHERGSLRGLTRTFGVARNTVSDWLKKSSSRQRVISSSEGRLTQFGGNYVFACCYRMGNPNAP